jgi:hypothetical protein
MLVCVCVCKAWSYSKTGLKIILFILFK